MFFLVLQNYSYQRHNMKTLNIRYSSLRYIVFLLVLNLIVVVPSGLQAGDDTMIGAFYERIEAPPWAMSVLSSDTGAVHFPTIKLEDTDSIKLMVIRDYSRFAPGGKGVDYLEVTGMVKPDGTFSIDLSEFKEGDLIAVVALKKGYIKLWHSFRFCEKCSYKNMKIVFVKIRNKNKTNQKLRE